MKIKSIKSVGLKKSYDIHIPRYGNFFLANGILSHNSGKTFIIRAISDRLYQAGIACVFIIDVKDEMKSSIKPLQPKFASLLAKSEKPTGMPFITFRPCFFQTLASHNKLPEDNMWYSPEIKDLEMYDFFTLFNKDKLTLSQQIALEEIYKKFKEYNTSRLEDVNEIIDDMTDITEVQKMALKYKFKSVINSKFFDDRFKKNIIRFIRNRITIGFNMNDFDSFGRDNSYPQVMVALTLRKIRMARKAKEIPRVAIFVDEAARFLPRNANPSSRIEFEESVDVDTRFGIDYWFATQGFNDIPEKIVKQCRYIFIPYNADLDVFRDAFKLSGLMKNIQVLNNQVARIKRKMDKHEWLIIDRNSNGYVIIKPVAPLSFHMETEK